MILSKLIRSHKLIRLAKIHTRITALFLAWLFFAIIGVCELILPEYSARSCRETFRIPRSLSTEPEWKRPERPEFDFITSESEVGINLSQKFESEVVDRFLILSDMHLSSLCAYSDVGMYLRRKAFQRYFDTQNIIVLGDICSTCGGIDGSFDIPEWMYLRHVMRFKRITGCNDEDLFGGFARCVVVAGNHDERAADDRRWYQNYPRTNRAGSFASGVSFYVLNAMEPYIPQNTSATLLLSHLPTSLTVGGSCSLRFINSTLDAALNSSSFRLAMAGNEHIYAFESADTTGTLPEVIVPSYNAIRAELSRGEAGCDGRMNCMLGPGLAVLDALSDHTLIYHHCSIIHSPFKFYIALLLLFAAAALYLRCFRWMLYIVLLILVFGYFALY